MLSDAHCHPTESLRAKIASSDGLFLINAINDGEFKLLKEIHTQYPTQTRVGNGFHPVYLCDYPKEQTNALLEDLNARIAGDPSLFVGEIGLDYRPKTFQKLCDAHACSVEEAIAHQVFMFKEQLMIAYRHKRPANVHVVSRKPGCWSTLFEVFASVAQSFPEHSIDVIIHSFNGSIETYQRLCRADPSSIFWISASHYSADNKHALRAIRSVGLRRLLLETDIYESAEEYDSLHEASARLVCAETQQSLADVLRATRENLSSIFAKLPARRA